MKKHRSIFYFIFFLYCCKSQEISPDFNEFKFESLMFDFGLNWDFNTTLGSIRYNESNRFNEIKNSDSLTSNLKIGSSISSNSKVMYGFAHFTYKKYLYGYLYPRIVDNIDNVPRYSGIPRDISRLNFISGETDLSGIGYENEWLSFQIGRGRESWGACDDINLVLSNDSSPYDYGMLSSNYGNLKVKYIHGFLESKESLINRYINARGFEWSNNKSLIVGFSEIIIYSGYNRSLDFGYLNPISTHLEIELNDKLNTIGNTHSNAVWQISLDFLYKNNIRISGNFLFDEFVLDEIQIAQGKEHGKASSLRISLVNIKSDKVFLNSYISYIRVGTPTFRHGNGNNNFIQRGKPLGWIKGSDGRELILGFNFINIPRFIGHLEFGQRKIGEESIINRPYMPYEDYLKGQFPSGNVLNINFCYGKVEYWLKDNISLFFDQELKLEKINIKEYSFNLGVDLYYPIKFKI